MGNPTTPAETSFSLRDLSLGSRLLLTVFLIAVGVSYLAGLNQLHFQLAPRGELLPGPKDTEDAYHGKDGVSTLERLVTADEHKDFNGGGSMRPAFFEKSSGWRTKVRKHGQKNNLDPKEAEKAVRADREKEADALVAWLKAGARKDDYEDFILPDNMQDEKLMLGLVERQDCEIFFKDEGKWRAHVNTVVEDRCARCHAPGKAGAAGNIHLENWESVHDYTSPEAGSGGMSLRALAQTTHVHLPGFALLLGVTGLVFSFTRYPGFIRVILCPLPLTVQLIDIAGWWLMRVDGQFAILTIVTGAFVALGLMLQIVLGVLDMYGLGGKAAWVLVLMLGLGGAYVAKIKVVDPYLAHEKAVPSARDANNGPLVPAQGDK